MVKRFLATITGVFVLTMLGCTFLPLKGIIIIGITFAVLGILFALIRIPLRQTFASAFLAIAISAGLFCADLYQIQSAQKGLIGGEHQISGEIADISTNSAGNFACYRVALNTIDHEPLRFYHRFSINLYSETKDLQVGDRVDTEILFFAEPLDYGFGKEDRILCSGYIEELPGASPSVFSWRKWLYSFKTNIRNRIAYGSDETIGLLKSLCYGDKSELNPALDVSLRRIGLSHVISVSGFHLSFAVLLFNYLMILLGVGHRLRYLLDIFICIFFTVAVGMPLSCVRACVMVVIFSLAMALDLFSDSLTSLGVAAFLIVLFNPQSIRDIGFLLSVFATLGMILLQSRIERFLFPPKIASSYRINWIYRKFTGVLSCSVAATLATLPIAYLVFETINIIGPLANVILIYPLELMFALGMGMSLLGWIPFLGSALGFLGDIFYVVIEWCANLLGKIPFAVLSRFDLLELVILGLLLLLIVTSVYFYIKHQKRCFWQLSALWVCFSLVSGCVYSVYRDLNSIQIAFIDVGQGDCTVISNRNSAVILDYGGNSQKRYQLIEYLRDQNIFNIELLAFTHLHADHTNGLNTLEKNCYIQKIRYPDLKADAEELPVKLKAMDAELITEDCTFSVLNGVTVTAITDTLYTSTSDENENCICYRVEFGDVSLLVTGDLTGSGELKICDRMKDVTILKVSHHGSQTSSLYPFLKTVSPDLAVISVGDNPYGLPSDQTITRLKTVVPIIYTTQDNGTIAFETNGKKLERIHV